MHIQNVNAQMAQLVNETPLLRATCRLTQYHRGLMTRVRDGLPLTLGELRNPVIAERSLTFEIVNIVGMMEGAVVPRRLYQAGCNYTYGSASCGVDLLASPNTIQTAVQAGTTRNAVVVNTAPFTTAGSPSDPTGYWENGYLVLANGPAALQARPIQRYAIGPDGLRRFFVQYPFYVSPEAGDTVVIRRGCPKNKTGCAERQADGTAKNYGGFEEVPYAGIKAYRLKGY